MTDCNPVLEGCHRLIYVQGRRCHAWHAKLYIFAGRHPTCLRKDEAHPSMHGEQDHASMKFMEPEGMTDVLELRPW